MSTGAIGFSCSSISILLFELELLVKLCLLKQRPQIFFTPLSGMLCLYLRHLLQHEKPQPGQAT